MMDRILDFENWMQENSVLSASTRYKYRLAVSSISKDMLREGVIHKKLIDMNLLELDLSIANIVVNPFFINKNKVGHNMYSNSLRQYRYYLLLHENDVDDKSEEALIGDVSETERVVLSKARVGQGVYRDELLRKYGGKCVITGIDHPKLLIASHIKPWKVANNKERIDVNNGLLLSANMDKLFDSGLITFKANGQMVISSYVGQTNSKLLGLSDDMVVNLLPTADLLRYMEYHRDVLFVK